MSISRKTPALVAGLALASSGLAVTTATTASANPASTGLVISEVYGAGGNVGATHNADFVELYNPTSGPLSMSGLSVQYRSAGGTASTAAYQLTGSVPAGTHYLIQMSTTGANGVALPTPDATASPAFAMSGTSGQVLLINGPSFTGTGDVAGNAGLIDMVGYGTGNNTFEGAQSGVALTAGTSANRNAAGTDTDHNANDLTEVAPTPQNAGVVTPPKTIVDATIAEIQGTGFSSPYAGVANTYVRTRGVVTAAYPAGGFSGFVIQTEGTGGGTDATPGASDGLWVRQNSGAITPLIGDFVEITAPVQENFGLTRLSYTPTDLEQELEVLTDDHAAVTPLVGNYPDTNEQREAHEGELLDVTGQQFTVTDNFDTNRFAEIGLATGDKPLIHPLDVGTPGSPEAQDVAADNAARAVTLDDGSSSNYTSGAAADLPVPWLTPTNPIRVGSPARLHAPVVLDFQFGVWRFQPTEQVTDEGSDVATFANTRSQDADGPQPVGGDLKLATFNVLNYFNTTGMDYVASGGSCTFFTDRDNDPVTNNDCGPTGPRGAAEDEDLQRQQDKIVAAINTLDADIVSLEEIENSVKLGEPRDDALSALVDALNDAAGSTRWAFVPSPDASELPPLADQDVIRTAFIYNPATVEAVGAPDVLGDDPDFSNAREPLAQAFKAAGTSDDAAFAVIVNHFKSKGDSTPPQSGNDNADTGNGAGAFNGDRTRQAQSLVEFAEGFATDRGLEKVFLAGDFNAYNHEDPLEVLYDAGFIGVESDTEGEATYSFDGLYGSLDHVLANEAAFADVTGADIWNINSVESVAFEYSRHNNNVTDFYQPDLFRASDHNPEIIGIDVPGFPAPAATTVTATAEDIPYGEEGTVEVDVDSANPTTGTVEVLDGTTVLGSAEVAEDGTATVTLPARSLGVGTHQLTVRYSGDEANQPSAGTVTVRVVKAKPTMIVDVDPDRVTTKTPVRLTVTLTAPGQTVSGLVWVHTDDGDKVRLLSNGQAAFDLGKFKKAGDEQVWITYSGSQTTEPVVKRITIRVNKR